MGRRRYKPSMTLRAVAGFENLFALSSSGTLGLVILTCQASVSPTVTWKYIISIPKEVRGVGKNLKKSIYVKMAKTEAVLMCTESLGDLAKGRF